MDVPAFDGLDRIIADGFIACEWSLAHAPGRLTKASAGLAALLRIDVQQLEKRIGEGLYWSTLIDPRGSATLAEATTDLAEHGRHGPMLIELHTADAQSAYVVLTSGVDADDPDRVTSLLADVTRFLVGPMAEDRASAVKSRFLAAVTHEFRTPLNAISGQASLLLEGVHGPLTDAQRRALTSVQTAARRLKSIVEDVLTTSRLETSGVTYAMSIVQLQPIVMIAADDVTSQCAAKDLGLYVDHAGTNHDVWTDPEKLQLIVSALFSNAIKFSKPGGRIVMDVATRPEVPDFIFLRVSDTGAGVPRDQIDRIFEPFVQASEGPRRTAEGLGLGLTMCREFARGMGGDVRVRSPETGGAVFTVAIRRPPSPPT
ncbi:MAG TPA: HAMP domain-containing sensor histidine kinase [Gemmatimonadaceae bacterium]|jgi:signal transduction histidine kinase